MCCRRCGTVKQEKLPWLADNPFYTRRFAFYVGRRCCSSAIRAVARELRLDWKTVKALEMEYMREQLRRVGTPAPTVIGIDGSDSRAKPLEFIEKNGITRPWKQLWPPCD